MKIFVKINVLMMLLSYMLRWTRFMCFLPCNKKYRNRKVANFY